MFSNLSAALNESVINYPISDSKLPFAQYIAQTRAIIEQRRTDLNAPNAKQIIDANSPYELMPEHPIYSGKRIKYGALLIHGLLDCPFSLRDIGLRFQAEGILCRSILLPGHGTCASDLLSITYHDWIQAVRYGVETLKNDVDEIYLVGYSTGATLSVYQALHDSSVKGIALLSPAIKIKAPVDTVVSWQQVTAWLTKKRKWIFQEKEIDYTKYRSIAFNAATQVSKLTTVIADLMQQHSLITPVFMAISREDETISSHRAIDFFSSIRNRDSKMLLYTSCDHRYPDDRIETRVTNYPDLHINHFSHVSIPFAPNNSHYGQHGDYINASHIDMKNVTFGAYSHLERRLLKFLKYMHLVKNNYRELTYNPDFEYMSKKLTDFVINK